MFIEGTGSLNDSMSGGMQLLPDPLYSLPTDNTYILAITSSDNGRIFLAGKDGCLYEVAYQVTGFYTQAFYIVSLLWDLINNSSKSCQVRGLFSSIIVLHGLVAQQFRVDAFSLKK